MAKTSNRPNRKKKRSEEEHAGNHERWLLTYADLITLLMIFFIIMYSMSNLDKKQFQILAQQLNATFGGSTVVVLADSGAGGILKDLPPLHTPAPSGTAQPSPEVIARQQMEQAMRELQQTLQESGVTASATVMNTERGIVVSFSDSFLFRLGSAQLNAEAVLKLQKVSAVLMKLDNYIRVEGYTDNLPIRTPEFPSNWELASQRALNVTKALISGGVSPATISFTSYGEYRPSYPNDSDANRRKNRRVDIVIIKKSLNVSEPNAPVPATIEPAQDTRPIFGPPRPNPLPTVEPAP